MAWVKVISAVVLQVRLPEPYCRELKTVEAVGLATDYSICSDDIPYLNVTVAGFIMHPYYVYYLSCSVPLWVGRSGQWSACVGFGSPRPSGNSRLIEISPSSTS